MSFTYKLTIAPACAFPEERNQQSLLRFATKEEARDFGQKMFEPPGSVIGWEVVEREDLANCSYHNKKFFMLR